MGYLPKMAPLKQGSRGEEVYMFKGCKWRIGGIVAPPHGILTKMIVPPTMVSGELLESSLGRIGGRCVDYLSLGAGVSCRIWSHTCGSWCLPKFLSKEGLLALMDMASFGVSGCALCLSVNNAEAFGADWMSCGTGMLVDGALRCSLNVPKCSASLSNILLTTVNLWVLVFVYDPTFLKFGVLVFGSHKQSPDDVWTLEVYLYPFPVTCPFELFSQSRYIWNHHGYVLLLLLLWHCCCGYCCVDWLLN